MVCTNCQFEECHLKGIIPDIMIHVSICSSLKEKRECCIRFRNKSVYELHSVQKNLPIIPLSKFDQVLGRRLHAICFPIIRRKLYWASKITAKLGRKPVTFFVKNFQTQPSIQVTEYVLKDNFVIEVRYDAVFAELRSYFHQYLRRHFEFNASQLTFLFSEIIVDEMSYLLTPNLHMLCISKSTEYADLERFKPDSVDVPKSKVDFPTLLRKLRDLPNRIRFSYSDYLEEPGWEMDLLSSGAKLESVRLDVSKITDFRSLAELCKNDVHIHLNGSSQQEPVVFDQDEMEKYFEIPQKLPESSLFINNLRVVPKNK